MRNLNEYVKKCMGILDDLSIPYGNVVKFKQNSRAKRWGLCKRVAGGFEIQINSCFLDERNDEKGLMNTILHELIHTCDGCFNHGAKWQAYGEKVQNAYGYRISRTSTAEEKGLSADAISQRLKRAKYTITCSKCGTVFYRERKSDVTEHPDHYRCGACHGMLEVHMNY